MSLFLGPIHYWLYNKIKIQNDITEEIINLSPSLRQELGYSHLRPLEEVIDTSNIHGWLQQSISLAEKRLAQAVTSLLKNVTDALCKLEEIFYNYGRKITQEYRDISPSQFYKLINDTLLDGMPCDRVNSIITEDENKVIYQRRACVHKEFWDEAGGDINIYYHLRNKLSEGMLDGKGLAFKMPDIDTFIIERTN